ncbi:neuroendocrine convertase 1-like [Schistocerca piceifrons]|uniref:neuroendocrine convertase 1-like n=1 Tax=Schistocerca piceifrons TaxID=274613 RepID=UPI001F5F48AA|nr:neuroendocrine convertase 1-like [Schistocerca piceifrons]XP_047121261.1 neuroendocrine convertase 1-like [Schistocerca piceifrons]
MAMWVQLLLAVLAGAGLAHDGVQNALHFSNEWVVRLEGGPRAAGALAQELGYVFLGAVPGFPDTYRMLRHDHPPTQKRASHTMTQRLAADARVLWAEQQFSKSRVKREDLPVPKQSEMLFNDELWDQEWYLRDTRTRPDLPKLDLHVLPVYAAGVTGRGVRVVVLDDGVERTHDDLRDNYDPNISFDANDDDPDPTPRYDPSGSNAHGTRCAGEIAMAANNGKCGVGVAFNARIGGVRLLDGDVNDRVEGVSLGWAHQLVDIYSASWGPNDDGRTVEGPGRLATEAIERGIREGRGGKGAIYVWASGNGGSRGDNCNCDGYINSVYTLSIGSASQHGQFPWYGERCAATFATAYSSGAYSDQMIATTDLRNSCTIRHTGTSAAAPLAAGIIALALEVNPELTWRDVQHLVAWTAEWAPLSDNRGWSRNAAGFRVNTRFGFGLMNAFALVSAAANWTNVPPKAICSTPMTPTDNTSIRQGVLTVAHFHTDGCVGTEREVNFLEHVELQVNLRYSLRGALEIYLTSAAGTRVELLSPRKLDTSNEGFKDWKFMSVLTWGERPSGIWTVEIIDRQGGSANNSGELISASLILHGTKDAPQHLKSGPRAYDDDYNHVHRKMAFIQPVEKRLPLDLLQETDAALDWADIVGVPLALRSQPDFREMLLRLWLSRIKDQETA